MAKTKFHMGNIANQNWRMLACPVRLDAISFLIAEEMFERKLQWCGKISRLKH